MPFPQPASGEILLQFPLSIFDEIELPIAIDGGVNGQVNHYPDPSDLRWTIDDWATTNTGTVGGSGQWTFGFNGPAGTYTLRIKDIARTDTLGGTYVERAWTVIIGKRHAYGVKWTCDYTCADGSETVINIKKRGYIGDPVEVCLGGEPLLIEYQETGSIYTPVRPSVATVNVLGRSDEFADIWQSEQDDYLIEVIKDDVLYWKGFIIPQGWSEPWFYEDSINHSIKATDRIGLLRTIPFGDRAGNVPNTRMDALSLIIFCLTDTLTEEDQGYGYRIWHPHRQVDMNPALATLAQVFLDPRAFEGLTRFEVLEAILSRYNLRIFQGTGGFWEVQCNEPTGGDEVNIYEVTDAATTSDEEDIRITIGSPLADPQPGEVIFVNKAQVFEVRNPARKMTVRHKPKIMSSLLSEILDVSGIEREVLWPTVTSGGVQCAINWNSEEFVADPGVIKSTGAFRTLPDGTGTEGGVMVGYPMTLLAKNKGFALFFYGYDFATHPGMIAISSVEIPFPEVNRVNGRVKLSFDMESVGEATDCTVGLSIELKLGDYYLRYDPSPPTNFYWATYNAGPPPINSFTAYREVKSGSANPGDSLVLTRVEVVSSEPLPTDSTDLTAYIKFIAPTGTAVQDQMFYFANIKLEVLGADDSSVIFEQVNEVFNTPMPPQELTTILGTLGPNLPGVELSYEYDNTGDPLIEWERDGEALTVDDLHTYLLRTLYEQNDLPRPQLGAMLRGPLLMRHRPYIQHGENFHEYIIDGFARSDRSAQTRVRMIRMPGKYAWPEG